MAHDVAFEIVANIQELSREVNDMVNETLDTELHASCQVIAEGHHAMTNLVPRDGRLSKAARTAINKHLDQML